MDPAYELNIRIYRKYIYWVVNELSLKYRTKNDIRIYICIRIQKQNIVARLGDQYQQQYIEHFLFLFSYIKMQVTVAYWSGDQPDGRRYAGTDRSDGSDIPKSHQMHHEEVSKSRTERERDIKGRTERQRERQKETARERKRQRETKREREKDKDPIARIFPKVTKFTMRK